MLCPEHRERHTEGRHVAAHCVVIEALEVSLGRRAEILITCRKALVTPLQSSHQIRREPAQMRENHPEARVSLENPGIYETYRSEQRLEHKAQHARRAQLQNAVERRRRDGMEEERKSAPFKLCKDWQELGIV